MEIIWRKIGKSLCKGGTIERKGGGIGGKFERIWGKDGNDLEELG
jgi:hypothetical protein